MTDTSHMHPNGTGSARAGFFARLIGAYWDFTGSTRRLLAERPSEATLLSFIMVVGVVTFLLDVAGWQLYPDPVARPEGLTARVVVELLVGGVLAYPLAVYLGAALLTPICWLFRGQGSWYETRLAVIWSSVVALPVTVLDSLVFAPGVRESVREMSPDFVTQVGLSMMSPTVLLTMFIFSAALTAAHSYRSSRITFGVVFAITMAIVLGAATWGASMFPNGMPGTAGAAS
ncbi:MAG: hypothetical protein AAFV62_02380 [Pseudomonadota bacterium]